MIEIVSETRCILGEGPAWDASRKSIAWVDIKAGTLFRHGVTDNSTHSWKIPGKPSAVVVARNGCYLIPSGHTIFEFDSDCGRISKWFDLTGEPKKNRCNDSKCDPFGSLWIGTMDDGEQSATGRLWRIDSSGRGQALLDGIGISNTLAWDADRERFYFADSRLGDIFVFNYDAGSGELSNKRVFFSRESAPGVPDGSAIDKEGYLWNARWNGGCIARLTPDGELADVIELPVSRPTSCAFGGVGLRTLFVTSAGGAADTAVHGIPEDGALFRFPVDVPGAPVPPFPILKVRAT